MVHALYSWKALYRRNCFRTRFLKTIVATLYIIPPGLIYLMAGICTPISVLHIHEYRVVVVFLIPHIKKIMRYLFLSLTSLLIDVLSIQNNLHV